MRSLPIQGPEGALGRVEASPGTHAPLYVAPRLDFTHGALTRTFSPGSVQFLLEIELLSPVGPLGFYTSSGFCWK